MLKGVMSTYKKKNNRKFRLSSRYSSLKMGTRSKVSSKQWNIYSLERDENHSLYLFFLLLRSTVNKFMIVTRKGVDAWIFNWKFFVCISFTFIYFFFFFFMLTDKMRSQVHDFFFSFYIFLFFILFLLEILFAFSSSGVDTL